jgi:dienelactone hydrolase
MARMMHQSSKQFMLFIGFGLLAITAACRADDRAAMIPTPDGLSLSATLTLPSGAPPKAGWPALLMIQGSGPTDRDGNSRLLPGVKVDLFPQIAAALAAKGVATLRYDKRGMSANAAQMPHDKSKLAAFFDWDRFVNDAVAGYKYLDSQPGIDPARVGILGHSEGSSLALVAADHLSTDSHPPRALVLLVAMGRTEDKVLHDQLDRIMDKQKATPAQKQHLLEENARIDDAIKKTGEVPKDVPAGLAGLYPAYLGPFLRGSLSVDDTALAAKFPGPVLLVDGERDVQVSPDLDGKPLDTALKTRHIDDHKFEVIPAASHDLKHVDSDKDAGFAGPVIPQALDVISMWSAEKLESK